MPEPRRARFRTGLALAACLSAGSAAAHPHVFIDGGANPVFDAEGRITALQVTWIYDPFTSLYMAEELGLPSDPDTPLSAEERASHGERRRAASRPSRVPSHLDHLLKHDH